MAEEPRFKFYRDLIKHQAEKKGDKPYILHEEQIISFADYNRATLAGQPTAWWSRGVGRVAALPS